MIMEQLQLPQPKMTAENIAAIAALAVSIVALSLAAIFIHVSEVQLGASATIFNRFWIATVAFGLWNGGLAVRSRLSEEKQPIKQQPYTMEVMWLLLGVGIVYSAALGVWAWSLTQTSIAHSTLMHYLTPMFTAVGEWLFWGRRFDSKFMLGMLVAILGSFILIANDFSSGNGKLIGDMAALLSAVFYALNSLIVDRLRTQLNSRIIMTWCSAISMILVFPIAWLAEEQLFPDSARVWLAVISLALICQILGMMMWGYCLKRLSPSFISVCCLSIPGLSALEAWLFFGEGIDWYTVAGLMVILLGVYLTLSSKSAIKAAVKSDKNSLVTVTGTNQ
ncbi:MAG: DMT family transporter [Hormoscilla sp. GUM202]|nr:DMT family transporter [Hormoscilla sp. GUM202]